MFRRNSLLLDSTVTSQRLMLSMRKFDCLPRSIWLIETAAVNP
jgi:hypothetical protein